MADRFLYGQRDEICGRFDGNMLFRLISLGLHPDLNPIHRPNDSSIRLMRYTAVVADRLWAMLIEERTRVGMIEM
ncbi:MAG TPA: hypothetical protein VGM38_00160 [Pseudolysinimonas sp.]